MYFMIELIYEEEQWLRVFAKENDFYFDSKLINFILPNTRLKLIFFS